MNFCSRFESRKKMPDAEIFGKINDETEQKSILMLKNIIKRLPRKFHLETF